MTNRPDVARTLGGPLCSYAAANLPDVYAMMQDRAICQ